METPLSSVEYSGLTWYNGDRAAYHYAEPDDECSTQAWQQRVEGTPEDDPDDGEYYCLNITKEVRIRPGFDRSFGGATWEIAGRRREAKREAVASALGERANALRPCKITVPITMYAWETSALVWVKRFENQTELDAFEELPVVRYVRRFTESYATGEPDARES